MSPSGFGTFRNLGAPDPIADLAMYGLGLPTSTVDPTSDAGAALDRAQKLLARRRLFDSELAAIGDDGRLSKLGKQDKARSLGEYALNDLGRIASAEDFRILERQEAKLSEQISGAAAASVDSVTLAFLWSKLEDVDPLERPILLREAIDAGDAATVEAFFRAPRILGLLSAADLEAGREAWAEARDPERARSLRDLRSALSTLRQVLAGCRSHIIGAAGLPGAELLEQVGEKKG